MESMILMIRGTSTKHIVCQDSLLSRQKIGASFVLLPNCAEANDELDEGMIQNLLTRPLPNQAISSKIVNRSAADFQCKMEAVTPSSTAVIAYGTL
jgi:hypothetical protein